MQTEYERDGIQLPDSDRETLRSLAEYCTNLETAFGQNIIKADQVWKFVCAAVCVCVRMCMRGWLGARHFLFACSLIDSRLCPQAPSRVVAPASSVEGLHPSLWAHVPQGGGPGTVTLAADPRVANAVMRHAPDGRVREVQRLHPPSSICRLCRGCPPLSLFH